MFTLKRRRELSVAREETNVHSYYASVLRLRICTLSGSLEGQTLRTLDNQNKTQRAAADNLDSSGVYTEHHVEVVK